MASLGGTGTPSTMREFMGGTLSHDLTAIYERLVAYSVQEALRTLEPRLRLLEQRVSVLGAKLDISHPAATDMESMASHPLIAHSDQLEHQRQSLNNDSDGVNGCIENRDWSHRVAGSHTYQHDGDEGQQNLGANMIGQYPQVSDTAVDSGTLAEDMFEGKRHDVSGCFAADEFGHTADAHFGGDAVQNECGWSLDLLSSSSHDHTPMVTIKSSKQEGVGTITPAESFTAAASSDDPRNMTGGKTRPSRNQRKKLAKASRLAEAHGLQHTPEHDLGAREREAKHGIAEDQNQPWHGVPHSRWVEIVALHGKLPDIDSPRWCQALEELLDGGLTPQEHQTWLSFRAYEVKHGLSHG